MLTKLDGKTIPPGFSILARTNVLQPRDCLAIPFEEKREEDGSIKTRRAIGFMYFVKVVEGKSEYTEWNMRVPEILRGESIQIEAKGPKDVIIVCQSRDLDGPNLLSWNSMVNVYRGVEKIGTVKQLREEAALIKDAAKNISNHLPRFEPTRRGIEQLAAIVNEALQMINVEAETSESENEDSEDRDPKDRK